LPLGPCARILHNVRDRGICPVRLAEGGEGEPGGQRGELLVLPPGRSERAAQLRQVTLEVGGGGRGDIHMLTAASVMHAAEACHNVLDKAVQIHGGSGYIWQSEINRLFRSTKLMEIGAGTTEVRKMIISGELLRDMKRDG